MQADQLVIPFGRALAVWAISWSVGGVALGQIALTIAGVEAGDTLSTGMLATLAGLSWAALLIGVGFAAGGARPALVSVTWGFSRSDLWWAPLGVVTQVLVVPVLYLPLRAIWPDTFDSSSLEETARSLVDAADGALIVLLVAVVAVGAPIVEEVVYRGMLQRSAISRFGPIAGWIAASAFFAAIHLRPVEFVGLFAAGALFGLAAMRSGRLGGAVIAHMAFNATGLLMLLW